MVWLKEFGYMLEYPFTSEIALGLNSVTVTYS